MNTIDTVPTAIAVSDTGEQADDSDTVRREQIRQLGRELARAFNWHIGYAAVHGWTYKWEEVKDREPVEEIDVTPQTKLLPEKR